MLLTSTIKAARGAMALKRKVRFLKKTIALAFGVFVTAYIFLTFYMTIVSRIQNLTLTGLNVRYVQNNALGKRSRSCTTEKTHFVFIKCMKCATESMGSIIRKFGYVRNLNFALPVKRNLYFGWPYPIETSDVRPSKYPYDILMEHSIYNGSLMRSLMPQGTSFITMIRNPWRQFQSTFNYFALGRIGRVPGENITEYLLHLDQYEGVYTSHENSQERWCIPDGFSMTRNIMSHCLGMPLGFPTGRHNISSDPAAVDAYIRQLDEGFDLVLIADYFIESLVLLKRTMCWVIKDIVYHHSNVGNYGQLEPRGHLYDIHKRWSHVDYTLFAHFNATFWRKVATEGSDFRDEVEHFRLIQMLVERFCFIERAWEFPDRYVTISASRFCPAFNVTSQDCSLMNTYMLPMLWAKYYEREGIEPENYGDPKDRPRPSKGCSI